MDRGSVEIAGCIENQSSLRKASIVADVGEAVDGAFRPARTRRRQLIQCSVTVRAVLCEHSVKVAGLVEDNTTPGVLSIAVALGLIENVLCPATVGWGQAINQAPAGRASIDGRAINVSRLVKGEIALGILSVSAREAIEDS